MNLYIKKDYHYILCIHTNILKCENLYFYIYSKDKTLVLKLILKWKITFHMREGVHFFCEIRAGTSIGFAAGGEESEYSVTPSNTSEIGFH